MLALAREAGAQQPQPIGPRVFYPPPKVAVFTSLSYERKQGAEVCPEEQTFRSELARRLGFNPFVPNPEGISVGDIRVVLTKGPEGFVARYEWTGSSDVPQPANRFEGPGRTRRDCYDVVVDVAIELAAYFVTLEIEYGRKFAPARPTPTCPSADAASAPAPCADSRFSVWPTEWPLPPLEKPRPKPGEPSERRPIAIRIGGTVSPELIASGSGSLGLSADVGVRYRAFSASVEAHGDPPLGSSTFPGGTTVRFARLSGALLLCAHWGWFAGCGVGDVGRFIFPDHPRELPASTFYAAVGVRAGLEFPVAPPRFFLRVGLDVRAPIHQVSYTIGTATGFQAAGPGVGLGLGFLAELPP
ncbi:MAG: hypothetical protein QM820_58160 [Minicystis sp.]